MHQNDEKSKIKSILKEANRYDDVVEILKTTIASLNTKNNLAVSLYYDNDGVARYCERYFATLL